MDGVRPWKLAFLAALAALHRIVILAWTTTIAADGPGYLDAAGKFAQGSFDEGLQTFLHPLYPLLTASFGTLLGGLERGGYFVSITAASLAVVPLVLWVRGWAGERVAIWTGILYALHPILSLECAEIANTGLFVGLLVTSVSVGLAALQGSHVALYPLAGILIGLCYLTRPEGLAPLLFMGVGAVYQTGRLFHCQKGAPDRGRATLLRFCRLSGGVLAAMIVCACLILPYLLWMRTRSGTWTLTPRPSAMRLLKTMEEKVAPAAVLPIPKPTPAPAPTAPGPAALAPSPPEEPMMPAIYENAGAPRTGSRLGRVGKVFLKAYHWPLLLAIVPGILLGVRKRPISAVAATWAMATCLWTPYTLHFCLVRGGSLSHRYFLAGVALTLPWAAQGVLLLWDWIGKRPRIAAAGSPPRWLAVAGCLLLGVGLLYKSIGPRRGYEITMIEAGVWLREQHIPRGVKLADLTGKVPYYAGCPAQGLWMEVENPRWTKAGDLWQKWDGKTSGPTYSNHTYITRLVVHDRKSPFLVLDEQTVRHYYEEGYFDELSSLGFVLAKTFERPDPKSGRRILIYRPPERP
jgi:hypothetical protein